MSLPHEGNPEINTAAGHMPFQQDVAKLELHDDVKNTAPMDDSAEKGEFSHATAGDAVLQQSHLIPMTGEVKVTRQREIVSYCLMCESSQ